MGTAKVNVAIIYQLLLCQLLAIVLSCNNSIHHGSHTIVVQPLGDFPQAQSLDVYRSIRKLYPNIVLRNNIPLPLSAWYKPRARYRADSLIHYLSANTCTDTVIIGLTSKDISTTKGTITDWGVMGLGYCPGNACVVSTFRLSTANKSGQFYKVAIHELGHTQGLPHCSNKSCYMRDAEGGNPLNEETGFCSTCSAYLTAKGWQLK